AGAARSFDEALQLDPDFFDAMANRVLLCRKLNRHGETVLWADRALRVREAPWLWYVKGQAHLGLGESTLAMKAFERALGLNPKGRSAVGRMRVADFVRRRGQPPTWRPAKAHQAALLTRIGHPDLAERLWESTMQLDAPGPWAGLGHAQLAGGFLAEAAKSFSRAAQMGEPGAELHRAEVLAAGGNFAG